MNLLWKARILLGPMRPFLLRKAVDALRQRIDVSRLSSKLPTRVHEGRSIRVGLTPLPSAEWFIANSASTMVFATSMRSGKVGAYGIEHWHVGDTDAADVDPRSIHELSRMHHWCAYALAAHIDADHRDDWCLLLYDEIVHFMSTTPAEHGIHWKFPMGTGLRLHSMLVAWDWARRSGWAVADADRVVAAYAVDHAICTLARRESRGGLSTSHYSANLLGILAAGSYINGERDAEYWADLARRELQRELPRQILDDGMVGEASTGYHRQVTDIFVHAASILHGDESTRFTANELLRIASAVGRCSWLDSIGMPIIGDNDDGMAMKLAGFMPDLSYLYDVSKRIGLSTVNTEITDQAPSFGLTAHRQNGIVVTLRNGPLGQFGKGGHAHNDQNSITISVGGEAFIVDVGCSVYSGDVTKRNEERSVHSHATMWWPNQEQAFMHAGTEELFWLLGHGLKTDVVENNEQVWHGSVETRNGRRHERRVTFYHNGLTCIDTCTDPKGEMAECVFPLGPNIEVAELNDGHAILRGINATLRLSWDNGQMREDVIDVSRAFAMPEHSHCLRLSSSGCTWHVVTLNTHAPPTFAT